MDALMDEVDSLEAILMDDVKITRNSDTGFPELIETTVFPTVGEEIDRQYICVTLQVIPNIGYPDISPNFNLVKPRGLDDNRLNSIKNACLKKLSDSIGYPVVFDLIDVIRENLTISNLPSGQCVICLYGFRDGDEFTKTNCFHYLHSYCLERHLNALKRNYQEEQDKLPLWLKKISDPFKATCPVCREPITDDSENLKNSKPPKDLENAPEFHLTNELKDLQQKMTNLYLYQKNRGSIIDPDAEECNVLSLGPINESRTPTTTINDNNTAVNSNFELTCNNQTNQSVSLLNSIKENGSNQQKYNYNASSLSSTSVSEKYSNVQFNNRRQSHNQQQQKGTNVINDPLKTNDEDSSSSSNNYNTYNRHSRRHHHHHHHHRSRRHHNHHNINNDPSNHEQHNQEHSSSNQQQQQQSGGKANIRNSYKSNNR